MGHSVIAGEIGRILRPDTSFQEGDTLSAVTKANPLSQTVVPVDASPSWRLHSRGGRFCGPPVRSSDESISTEAVVNHVDQRKGDQRACEQLRKWELPPRDHRSAISSDV
jgi:hypothetical protein